MLESYSQMPVLPEVEPPGVDSVVPDPLVLALTLVCVCVCVCVYEPDSVLPLVLALALTLVCVCVYLPDSALPLALVLVLVGVYVTVLVLYPARTGATAIAARRRETLNLTMVA